MEGQARMTLGGRRNAARVDQERFGGSHTPARGLFAHTEVKSKLPAGTDGGVTEDPRRSTPDSMLQEKPTCGDC